MSIAKNSDAYEVAIRSALRELFQNGYAIDIYDSTEDMFEEGDDALALEVVPKKDLFPWCKQQINFLFLFEGGEAAVQLLPVKYCDDVKKMETLAAAYVNSACNSVWKLEGERALTEKGKAMLESADEAEEAPENELYYMDYSSYMCLEGKIAADPNRFEAELTELLGAFNKEEFIAPLQDILSCFSSDCHFDSLEKLTFDWDAPVDVIDLYDAKKNTLDRITLKKGGHLNLRTNNTKINVYLSSLGFVEITHPTLFKKGSIAFGDDSGYLEVTAGEYTGPVMFFVAKECKKELALLESVLAKKLEPLGIRVITRK